MKQIVLTPDQAAFVRELVSDAGDAIAQNSGLGPHIQALVSKPILDAIDQAADVATPDLNGAVLHFPEFDLSSPEIEPADVEPLLEELKADIVAEESQTAPAASESDPQVETPCDGSGADSAPTPGQKLAKAIYGFAEAHEIGISAACRGLQIAPSQLSSWRRGLGNPSSETVQRIQKQIGYTPPDSSPVPPAGPAAPGSDGSEAKAGAKTLYLPFTATSEMVYQVVKAAAEGKSERAIFDESMLVSAPWHVSQIIQVFPAAMDAARAIHAKQVPPYEKALEWSALLARLRKQIPKGELVDPVQWPSGGSE